MESVKKAYVGCGEPDHNFLLDCPENAKLTQF